VIVTEQSKSVVENNLQYSSQAAEYPTEEGQASQAIYDVESLDDGDEANQSKREVDQVIAEELQ